MQSLILAATLASLSFSLAAPVQAASSKLALTAQTLTAAAQVEIDRRGRGTDSARDRKERP